MKQQTVVCPRDTYAFDNCLAGVGNRGPTARRAFSTWPEKVAARSAPREDEATASQATMELHQPARASNDRPVNREGPKKEPLRRGMRRPQEDPEDPGKAPERPQGAP